jgi:hypothetical protein
MAFTYRIDKESRTVRLEGEPPDIEEWKKTLSAVFADPDFEKGFSFLSDRRFSDKARSSDFLKAALAFLQSHEDKMGRCKWATVVSTTVAYGMGRMVQILSENMNIEVEVFTDIDKARLWLAAERTSPGE